MNGHANGHGHDVSPVRDSQSKLLQLLWDIRRDLGSQLPRLLPNLKLVLATGETVLNRGLVDDRKYLVWLRCEPLVKAFRRSSDD